MTMDSDNGAITPRILFWGASWGQMTRLNQSSNLGIGPIARFPAQPIRTLPWVFCAHQMSCHMTVVHGGTTMASLGSHGCPMALLMVPPWRDSGEGRAEALRD